MWADEGEREAKKSSMSEVGEAGATGAFVALLRREDLEGVFGDFAGVGSLALREGGVEGGVGGVSIVCFVDAGRGAPSSQTKGGREGSCRIQEADERERVICARSVNRDSLHRA